MEIEMLYKILWFFACFQFGRSLRSYIDSRNEEIERNEKGDLE
jgi:hypothetical protein